MISALEHLRNMRGGMQTKVLHEMVTDYNGWEKERNIDYRIEEWTNRQFINSSII